MADLLIELNPQSALDHYFSWLFKQLGDINSESICQK